MSLYTATKFEVLKKDTNRVIILRLNWTGTFQTDLATDTSKKMGSDKEDVMINYL